MRIALLTEGGYPYARGESVVWCDRLVRGLDRHEFEVYALSRSARQEDAGWRELPVNVTGVRTAPLWDGEPVRERRRGRGRGAPGGAQGAYGRRERRLFGECFHELVSAVCGAGPSGLAEPRPGAEPDGAEHELADRFAGGLYGLAALARDCGGLAPLLRSELAVRVLQSACRAPGTLRAAHSIGLSDLLAVVERLERALRPLSLDWYGPTAGLRGNAAERERGTDGGDEGLSGVDLCHAVGGGPAALAGLVAKHFFGTPLLVTEYGVRLREHYLSSAADSVAPTAAGAPVRALLASFQRQLAREAYGQAHLITPGNTHTRRWQERCGAPREKLRTVYPGMDAAPFAEIGEAAAGTAPDSATTEAEADSPTIVWVGRVSPEKDLIGLLHAFSEVRSALPGARLRLVTTSAPQGREAAEYEERCRSLTAQLFPDEAAGPVAVGECPVTFEEVGGPAVPTRADAYGAGSVVVLPSSVEGFPTALVEAMFAGRATVSTDVGAVCEVIGGTGLVVPPRNPRALADSCITLLRDPVRCRRLGAAARARALELFTVEQNVEAFRGIYLELMSRCPVRAGEWPADGQGGEPHPFGRPAEAQLPGRWAEGTDWSAAAAARAGGVGSAGTGLAAGAPTALLQAERAGPEAETRPLPAPAARGRTTVPSWARPDLPDDAPVTRRQDRRRPPGRGEQPGQRQDEAQEPQRPRSNTRKGDSR